MTQTCLVNLIELNPPKNGGIRNLTLRLCRYLFDHHPRVVFAVGADYSEQFAEWLERPGCSVLPSIPGVELSPLVRSLQPDFIFTPIFGHCTLFDLSESAEIPHVICVPDALGLDRLDLLPPYEEVRKKRVDDYHRLRNTKLVITVSEHSRQRLIDAVGLRPEQVVVIHHGLGIDESTVAEPIDVPGPFVVYPANGWPNKRHELLLRTMIEVWKTRPEMHVLFTGWQPDGMIESFIEKHQCPAERVHRLGFIPSSQLAFLYDNAVAMPFISEYEGSGTPLVEAMARGCPVICAPNTGVPEYAGEAAIYVDSENPKAWASALLASLPARREEMVRLGKMQASKFRWDSFLIEHHAAFVAAGLDLQESICSREAVTIPVNQIAHEFSHYQQVIASLHQQMEEKEAFLQNCVAQLQNRRTGLREIFQQCLRPTKLLEQSIRRSLKRKAASETHSASETQSTSTRKAA